METTNNEAVKVDNEWRRWIAENLILESDPNSMYQVMVQSGISQQEASSELSEAMRSPYIAGATRLKNRLKKRMWPLDIQRKLNKMDARMQEVPRRHKISADELYNEFYLVNRPVIITGMMEDWPAMERWTDEYFLKHFADREVEVQFGRNRDTNFEINKAAHKRTMRFGDYVQMIQRGGETNDYYMTATNSSSNQKALRELWDDIVQIPEYLTSTTPDNGFFWFGPQGTKTPFHHDLTNNFMAQVRGRKLIKIVPAVEIGQIYNELDCYSAVDGSYIDYQRFPKMRDAQTLDMVLNPGEILFLPVGCWHYVEGLDVTITVSFINFRWDNDFSSFYDSNHPV